LNAGLAMSLVSQVIILFGGTSSERRVSVASAQHLSSIIPEAELWFWSKSGPVYRVDSAELSAHQNAYDHDFKPRNSKKISDGIEGALDTVKGQVLYLGLHGGDGENGWLQSRLEARGIAFTGSGSSASALAMNKSKSKDAVKPRGVLMARQLIFTPAESGSGESLKNFQKSLVEIVIKPACDGSSAGLAFISDGVACQEWLDKNTSSREQWLAEERLVGRELTVGVIMHNGLLMVLPPSEVVLERNVHFDYQAKYHGVGNKEITPAELTQSQSVMAQSLSILAHTAIGCFGYTRTDMIMTDKGFYYLETNTLPGMTRASFIPQQLRAAGIDLRDFVRGQLAVAKKRYE